MSTSQILPGEPFSKEKTQQIAKQFHRDGFVHIPGVLSSDEITALRDTTDRLFADESLADRTNPHLADTRYIQVRPHDESGEELPFILRNTIELDSIFREMLVREPILSWLKPSWGKAVSSVVKMCCGICPVYLLSGGMSMVRCISRSPTMCHALIHGFRCRSCGSPSRWR